MQRVYNVEMRALQFLCQKRFAALVHATFHARIDVLVSFVAIVRVFIIKNTIAKFAGKTHA